MAKKNSHARKASGASAIPTIEEVVDQPAVEESHAANGESPTAPVAAKPKRGPKPGKPKPKPESVADGGVVVADIKKAAAFASSVGGLDKAINLLQILKVAKEVQ
jgi:hypothetical protein